MASRWTAVVRFVLPLASSAVWIWLIIIVAVIGRPLKLVTGSSFPGETSHSPASNISVSSASGDAILDFKGNGLSGKVIMIANKKNGLIKSPINFDQVEEIDNGNQIKLRKTVQLGDAAISIKVGTGSGMSRIIK